MNFYKNLIHFDKISQFVVEFAVLTVVAVFEELVVAVDDPLTDEFEAFVTELATFVDE